MNSLLTGNSKHYIMHENPVVSQSVFFDKEVIMTFQDIKGRYKQISGFPNYFITEFGEIYSNRLRGNEKEPHLHKLKPKNPGKSNKYLNIILCNEYGQYTKSIHRLVADAFVEGWFEGAVVNHIDGNNRNNEANNLEWTTTKDNIHKSYVTSGKSARRNYKIWSLYDPYNCLVGKFSSHLEMETYVRNNNLDAAPSQLTKNKNSRGFKVITE